MCDYKTLIIIHMCLYISYVIYREVILYKNSDTDGKNTETGSVDSHYGIHTNQPCRTNSRSMYNGGGGGGGGGIYILFQRRFAFRRE